MRFANHLTAKWITVDQLINGFIAHQPFVVEKAATTSDSRNANVVMVDRSSYN